MRKKLIWNIIFLVKLVIFATIKTKSNKRKINKFNNTPSKRYLHSWVGMKHAYLYQ